jgi:hypothetical protein
MGIILLFSKKSLIIMGLCPIPWDTYMKRSNDIFM